MLFFVAAGLLAGHDSAVRVRVRVNIRVRVRVNVRVSVSVTFMVRIGGIICVKARVRVRGRVQVQQGLWQFAMELLGSGFVELVASGTYGYAANVSNSAGMTRSALV